MTVPLSVTVRLRAGVTGRATLPDPDNRVLQPGTGGGAGAGLEISLETYNKIGLNALKSIIEVTAWNTTVQKDLLGLDLTYNGGTPPTGAGGTQKMPVGLVVMGDNEYDQFKLVKVTGAATAGAVLAFVTPTNFTLTHSGTSIFAGVAVAAVTSGNYGWVQIAGYVPVVQMSAAIAAGVLIALDPANNGKARAVTGGDVPIGTSAATIGAAGNVDSYLREARGPKRHYRSRQLFNPAH